MSMQDIYIILGKKAVTCIFSSYC